MSVNSNSSSAAPPPNVPPSTDRTPDTTEERQRYEQRQRELQRIAPPEAIPTEPQPAPAAPGQQNCINVVTITVEGATHLPDDELADLTRPYSGRCLPLAELDHLIAAINQAYVDIGLVSSRAYVPQQSLDGGALRLVVVEGTLEAIELSGQDPGWIADMAFPSMIGDVLNLRDIEQGLEQMNRLPSFNAKMKIEPGQAQGTSVILVDAPMQSLLPSSWTPQPWLRGHVTIDNDGTTQSGRDILRTGIDADNPLGLLDSWSVSDARSATSHPSLDVSNEVSTAESLPYGYWTVFGSFDHSDYHSQVVGPGTSFESSGGTDRYSFGVNRVLARDQISKTSIELSYDLKETTSSLDDVVLATGSQNLASATLKLSRTERIWGGAWYLTLGYTRGLHGLGTSIRDHAIEPSTTPRAQYDKGLIDLDGFQPFEIGGATFNWHPSLHLEYSPEVQYSQTRLIIGGLYTVRGFQDLVLLGDRGGSLRNDVSWRLPAIAQPTADLLLGKGEIYVGLDAGAAYSAAGASSDGDGVIAGWALGLRSVEGMLVFDTTLAHAFLHGPFRDEGYLVNFTAGIRF